MYVTYLASLTENLNQLSPVAPNDTHIPGCNLVHASSIVFFAYILLVVAETGMILLSPFDSLLNGVPVMVVLTMVQAYRYSE